MIKLSGTWTQIDPDETNWQCEYGHDDWDISCGTCTISPDKSSYAVHGNRGNRQNRAHWRTFTDDTHYLCSVHYDMLTYKQPEAPPFVPVSADEFASAFDTK